MKKLYLFTLLLFFTIGGMAQDSSCVTIHGDISNGKFTQLWLASYLPFAADSSHSELGAASWECDTTIGFDSCRYRSLFRYDLSNIPSNAVVTSASLYLYANSGNTTGMPGSPTTGNNQTLLQRVLAPWNTAGTGWANQPPVTAQNQQVLAKSTHTAQDYVVNVTDFAQYWVNHPDSNYGAMLRLQSPGIGNTMIFHSGTHADTLNPRLIICYTVPDTTIIDSCSANFIDSSFTNLFTYLTPLPSHSNNQLPMQICWNFGDGTDTCISYSDSLTDYSTSHTYDSAGVYNVCVTIQYFGGCVAMNCRNIVVQGPPDPVPDSCSANFIDSSFTNLFTYFYPLLSHSNNENPMQICWSFGYGDSTCISYSDSLADYSTSHTYDSAGVYNVCVTIQYFGGCVAMNCRNIVVQGPPDPVPDSCSANFIDSSFTNLFTYLTPLPSHSNNKNPMQICWSFGDGDSTCISYSDSLADYSTSHTYDSAGVYNVCVTIQYFGGCVAMNCRNIVVQGPPDPVPDSCGVNFTDSVASNNPLFHTYTVIPLHSNNKKPVQICWNFGDGTDTCLNYNDSLNNYFAGHLYDSSGQYNVCVTVTYAGGCIAQHCRNITVFGSPGPEDSTRIVVKLYPNPTPGPLLAWIHTNKAVSGDIRLYDLRGNLKYILKNNIYCTPGVNVFTMQIPRGSLNGGLYYVKIRLGSEVKTFKVLLL